MSASFDILIKNVLYPITRDFSRWQRGDVGVSDGVIADIGPDLSNQASERIEASTFVAIPGLFNLHTHGHDLLWRGSRDDAGVDRTWPEWFWPLYHSISLDAHVAAATTTYLANILGGVTFVADQLRSNLSAEPFVAAQRRVGLHGRVHSHLVDDERAALALPHETSELFEPALERAAALSRRPIMIHAQETDLRLNHVLRRFGRSTVELLDLYGLLHEETFLVHMGHWSDHDLALIASRRSSVVLTPTAEMKLGERTFDAVVALERGISVVLGSDGPAYHNGEDFFTDLKLLSLLTSAKYGAGRLPAGEILAIATWKSAQAVGRPTTFLEPGGIADIALLDGESFALFPFIREPFDNVAQQLVLAATRESVRFVIAGGKCVVANHRTTMVDDADVIRQFRQAASQYHDFY